MKTELKSVFLNNLKASGGILSPACESTGISRATVYHWRQNDPDFDQAFREIKESQIDFVESKLMQLINSGDTTATIFYLKTMGKQRGWSEKAPLQTVVTNIQTVGVSASENSVVGTVPERVERIEAKSLPNHTSIIKIEKKKKRRIIKLLKESGKYSIELTGQIELTAAVEAKIEIIKMAMEDGTYQPIFSEMSREGNERRIVNPLERLLQTYIDQDRMNLRALGMNTDSRERKGEGPDPLADFTSEFQQDLQE